MHRWYDEALPEDQSSDPFGRVAPVHPRRAAIVDGLLWMGAAAVIGVLIVLALFF